MNLISLLAGQRDRSIIIAQNCVARTPWLQKLKRHVKYVTAPFMYTNQRIQDSPHVENLVFFKPNVKNTILIVEAVSAVEEEKLVAKSIRTGEKQYL